MSNGNKNYILQLMRESHDPYDKWASAMSWAFACAENLAAIGAEIPAEMEFSPSPLGPVIESYEDERVQEYLDLVNVDVWTDDDETKVSEVQEAGRILARYLDWLRAAGEDY